MANHRVYKADGTVQCAPPGQGEITLDEMRAELATLIGPENILSGEKRRAPGLVIAQCGAPSGIVNTYLVTPHGLALLLSGIVGTAGYLVWPEAEVDAIDPGSGPVVPWPLEPSDVSPKGDTIPWPWQPKGDQETRATVTPFDRPVIWPWDAISSAENPTAAYITLLNILGSATSVGAHPTTLDGILGLPCRTYTVGARLTLDYSPSRINIELSKTGRISRIWFG